MRKYAQPKNLVRVETARSAGSANLRKLHHHTHTTKTRYISKIQYTTTIITKQNNYPNEYKTQVFVSSTFHYGHNPRHARADEGGELGTEGVAAALEALGDISLGYPDSQGSLPLREVGIGVLIYVVLYMQSVLVIWCFICKVSSLCSAVYKRVLVM